MKTREIQIVVPGVVIVFALIIALLALSIMFDHCNARIAEQKRQWRERTTGGIEQNIPSPPPKRTESISIGRVSDQD